MELGYYWKKKTIVSFVLTLLVVLIHNTAAEQYIIQLAEEGGKGTAVFVDHLSADTIARVAVPLFFLLSGVTFFRDYQFSKLGNKLKRRLKSLVIPYFTWNFIIMLFYIVCSYTPIQNYFLQRERFVISPRNVMEAICFYKCNLEYWFIYNLIIFTIFSPVIDFFISKKWSAVLTLLLAFYLPLFPTRLLGRMHLNAGSLVFYVLGCIIGKHYFHPFSMSSPKRRRILGFILCLACMTIQMLQIYHIVSLSFLSGQLLLIIFCFAFWIAMDTWVERMEVREYMKFSFFIYASHLEIQSVFVKIIYLLGPKKIWMAYVNLVLSYCATIFFTIWLGTWLKKRWPKVYGVLSGSR